MRIFAKARIMRMFGEGAEEHVTWEQGSEGDWDAVADGEVFAWVEAADLRDD